MLKIVFVQRLCQRVPSDNSQAFLPFMVIIALFLAILYIYLPETKGKTVEAISDMMSAPGAWSGKYNRIRRGATWCEGRFCACVLLYQYNWVSWKEYIYIPFEICCDFNHEVSQEESLEFCPLPIVSSPFRLPYDMSGTIPKAGGGQNQTLGREVAWILYCIFAKMWTWGFKIPKNCGRPLCLCKSGHTCCQLLDKQCY